MKLNLWISLIMKWIPYPIYKLQKQLKMQFLILNLLIVYTTPQYDVNVDHTSIFHATLTATRPRKNYHVKKVFSFEILSSTEWYFPVSFITKYFCRY